MKLFGYSISLNVLILIGVLYLIMVVNALSASCNMEGIKVKGPAGREERKKDRKQEEEEAQQAAEDRQAYKEKRQEEKRQQREEE
jgi:hypothetical protein